MIEKRIGGTALTWVPNRANNGAIKLHGFGPILVTGAFFHITDVARVEVITPGWARIAEGSADHAPIFLGDPAMRIIAGTCGATSTDWQGVQGCATILNRRAIKGLLSGEYGVVTHYMAIPGSEGHLIAPQVQCLEITTARRARAVVTPASVFSYIRARQSA